MSKFSEKLARRYARALLRSVPEGTDPRTLARELSDFASVWSNDEHFSQSVKNPMFNPDERKRALIRIASEAGLSKLSQNFLSVLFERDRIAGLPEISAAFSAEADKQAGIIQVEIVSAKELEESEQRETEAMITEKLSGSPAFTWKVDSALIGGLIVRFEGKVLDGSIRGRLNRIGQRLLAA